MRWLRLMAFHIRQFVVVPHFVQLMLISTLTTTVVQFVAWRAWGVVNPADAWTRAGTIGMWTTCTAAAGIIGFERFKGTLVHLVLSPLGALRTAACVVLSAATFGILAFPVAWVAWALTSQTITFDLTTPARVLTLAMAVAALWLGCAAMCLVVASLFVLTPNAITYEELLLTPILLCSGLLFTLASPPTWIAVLSKCLPLSWPIDLLFSRPGTWAWPNVLGWVICCSAWFIVAALAGRVALRRATVVGTLEVL